MVLNHGNFRGKLLSDMHGPRDTDWLRATKVTLLLRGTPLSSSSHLYSAYYRKKNIGATVNNKNKKY